MKSEGEQRIFDKATLVALVNWCSFRVKLKDRAQIIFETDREGISCFGENQLNRSTTFGAVIIPRLKKSAKPAIPLNAIQRKSRRKILEGLREESSMLSAHSAIQI